MDILSILSQRINLPDIKRIVALCEDNADIREYLWQLLNTSDRRVSNNALWVLTHLDDKEHDWIESRREEVTDMLMLTTDTSKKRMLLQLLRGMDHTPENSRTDLLDFCFSRINAECEPYAVRAFSIYVAFKICRHYPELIAELEEHLSMLTQQDMSPGLKSARRKILGKIKSIRENEARIKTRNKSSVSLIN